MRVPTKLKAGVIRCPHCGWEYVPAEIIYPDALVGKLTQVVRDPNGKIIYEEYDEGEEPDFQEHFTCENCDKPFVVEIATSFKTKEEAAELDFSEEFVSLLD